MQQCEKCEEWFIRRTTRMVGLKYCSERCAKNMAQKQYRLRKSNNLNTTNCGKDV